MVTARLMSDICSNEKSLVYGQANAPCDVVKLRSRSSKLILQLPLKPNSSQLPLRIPKLLQLKTQNTVKSRLSLTTMRVKLVK